MKPGMTTVPRAIDHERVAGLEVRSNGRDRLAVNQDVGLLEVAHLRVEAEDDASAQQDTPPAIGDDIRRSRPHRQLAV